MHRRILYVQHANAMGGSVLSLLSLIERLDRGRFTPIVACLSPIGGVVELYRERGIETFHWPGLLSLPHTTGGWLPLYDPRSLSQLCRTLFRFPRAVRAMRELIADTKPDLVHLNSVVLGPCALGAAGSEVPVVWHVREVVVHGHVGLRRSLIRRWLTRLPSEVVFISSDERRKLLGGDRGVHIPNFVDLERFDHLRGKSEARRDLGLAEDDQVVLFVGGLNRIKGVVPLVEALAIERERNPRLVALIAGGISPTSQRLAARLGRKVLPLVGRPTARQKVMKTIRRHRMEGYVRLLPYQEDIAKLLAACDLLVFPSVEPHFARPVIEAGAMARPVVASRIGGVAELVSDGKTGALVPPSDPGALAAAIHEVLSDRSLAMRMGRSGRERVRLIYSEEVCMKQINEMYERVLARSNHG